MTLHRPRDRPSAPQAYQCKIIQPTGMAMKHENMKICSGGYKMRNAGGHQCKGKMSGSEKKVNENTYDISSIKKFLEVSRCSRAKQRQRNVQKKCAARACKVNFLLIRPIVVFHRCPALPSPLSITRFYILFEQTTNII